VNSVLRQVVGAERMPDPADRPATKLIPHITLAYTKDSSDDHSTLQEQLNQIVMPETNFRPQILSLVKQMQFRNYYRWNIIEKLNIGTMS